MALRRYRFFYKLKAAGGLKALFGKTGIDLYISLLLSILYILLVHRGVIDPNWIKSPTFLTSFIIPIIVIEFAILGIIINLRNKVISKSDFNIILDKNDLLAGVEFHLDYSVILSILTICSSFLFILLRAVLGDSVKILSYIFSILIFFIAYSFFNLYYSIKVNQYHSGLEIKYSDKYDKK